jgi:hypothetical protein
LCAEVSTDSISGRYCVLKYQKIPWQEGIVC